MRSSAWLWIVLAAGASGAVRAQCCLGAQHVEARSPDGRYLLEARSLTGTGPAAHGPYHFRFSLRRAESDAPLGQFEGRYPVRRHFSMAPIVSPTGNGFLLRTSLRDDLALFGAGGRELAAVRPGPGRRLAVLATSADGLFVDVAAHADLDRKVWTKRRFRLFVPLGSIVGREFARVGEVWQPVASDERWFPVDADAVQGLRRMLHWSPAQGEREAAQVRRLLDELRAGGAAATNAADELVELGLSARSALRAGLASAEAAAVETASAAARSRRAPRSGAGRGCARSPARDPAPRP